MHSGTKRRTLDDPVSITTTVPFDRLSKLRVRDVPFEGFEVTHISIPSTCTRLNVQVRNHGHREPNRLDAFVFADVDFRVPVSERGDLLARVHRGFSRFTIRGSSKSESAATYRTHTFEMDGEFVVTLDVGLDASNSCEALVSDVLLPLVSALRAMDITPPSVFICHASEDKPLARSIAVTLRNFGAKVWLDEWEIRVGDSIVERINAGLEASSNLIVVLSKNSVNKPWVRREFSSALMAQLSKQCVAVLPVRLDDAEPPRIIADIKYADARAGIEHAIEQLRCVLFQDRSSS
jgi:hypothetical protein